MTLLAEKNARLSHLIATTSKLDQLLNDVVMFLSQEFDYLHCAIFLTSTSEAKLKLKAATSASGSLPPHNLTVPLKGRTMISHVVSTAGPALCNDLPQAIYTLFDYFSIEARSALSLPLISSQHIVGVLDVQSREPNRYTDQDVYQLQWVAGQLALAIENKRLVKERNKRLIELGTFNQIGMIIAEQRDLETIFSNTVERVRSLFRVEGASLLLLEENNLRFVAAAGAAADEIKPFILKRGQGIAWSVVETQKTIRVTNARNDPRHFDEIDAAIGFTTRSLLAVPIRLQDRILGVLEVMNRLVGQPFSRADETIVEFIVSSVAVAIENARLFDQTRHQVDRITGLLQASYALSTLDLDDILDTIVHQAGNLLKADHTVVYLVDHESQTLKPTAVHSVGEMKGVPTPPFHFNQGTVGWVVNHRQSLRINDVGKDERFIQISTESKRIVNLVAVPLVVKQEIIGALEATHKMEREGFTIEDESLLTAFASQAGVAIHHARLYREKQQQIWALTTLTQTSEAITKADTLDQLLNIVLNSAMSIIETESGAIILVDEGEHLRIQASQGISSDIVHRFNELQVPKSIGTFGETYRQRNIVEITDSKTDPNVFISERMNWALPKTFTNIPLVSGQDFIGLITLYALPTKDNRSLLQAVADMAAVAIAKTRLFDEIGQRLAEVSTLYTLAEQMTRVLDLDRVVEYSVTILKHAIDCSGCCLFLKEEGEPFQLRAHIGWGLNLQQLTLETNYIVQLAERLTTKPYPIYLNDLRAPDLSDITPFNPPDDDEDIAWPNPTESSASPMRSVMIVPLVVKNEVIGALSITNSLADAFSQAEGRLLTIAAAQISTAIENIRLYDNLERRAIELEAALDEVAEANRLKSEFVQNVSHELRTPLTFILSYVELILEGTLGDVPPIIHEKLKIVSQKTQVTSRLVDDITSLQKIEAGNLLLNVISPDELVTRATQGARANAAQFNIEIVSHCPAGLPNINVDPDRVMQVFDNLVANALKFSDAGSQIRIEATQEEDRIKFSVQDQGIGIPADKLDKIFERFYQVDGTTTRRYGGTGLGLAIIKQIIEVHGGSITAESVVGEGTTFTFWLPIYAGETAVSVST